MTVDTGTRPEVICIGEAMALIMATPGMTLSTADRFTASVAGAEATVAVGLARLGHRAAFVGRVGSDGLGELVLRRLRAEDVDTTHVVTDSEAPTGVLVRDCHARRPIEVCYYRAGSAGSRLNPEDIDIPWLSSARMLHISGITAMVSTTSRGACRTALAAAREHGVIVSVDPNLRYRVAGLDGWSDVAAELFEAAHIINISLDELTALTGGQDPGILLERGAQLVVVKNGSQGADAYTRTERHSTTAVPVPVVDPVGAGDALTAGLLSALLRNLPLPTALREAAAVAALCVASPGDLTGLPDATTRDALVDTANHDLAVRR